MESHGTESEQLNPEESNVGCAKRIVEQKFSLSECVSEQLRTNEQRSEDTMITEF